VFLTQHAQSRETLTRQVSSFFPKNVDDSFISYSAGRSVNARKARTGELPVPLDLRHDTFSFIGSDMFHVEQNIPVLIIALLFRGDSSPRKTAKDPGIPHQHLCCGNPGVFWMGMFHGSGHMRRR